MGEHKARLFNDYGWASGRGWYIIHSETCSFPKDVNRCDEAEDMEAVKEAVLAIYDAHDWPYPRGLWPVLPEIPMNKEVEFTAEELRNHLAGWLENQKVDQGLPL